MFKNNLASAAFCTWILAMPPSVQPAESGSLSGRFVYNGELPAKPNTRVNRPLNSGNPILMDESLLVDPKGGIANVVIYVRTPNVPVPEATPAKRNWEIRGGRFSPHIVSIWLGKQTLMLKNSDPINYNPHLAASGERGHNPLLPVGSEVQLDFHRSQSIPVPVSDIHPWLRGYVLPRNNPFVAVSDADGSFKIENLPAQELEFQAWHERAGYLDIPEWPKGRFTRDIHPDENDMGTIKIKPFQFDPRDRKRQ